MTKQKSVWIAALALVAFIHAGAAHAAKFSNQFVEFELPAQWQCNLEGAEWVCQSLNEQKKRDAIIVLAAKLKGDQDSLDQYTTYLKAPKIYTSVQGKSVKSDPKYAKPLTINQQQLGRLAPSRIRDSGLLHSLFSDGESRYRRPRHLLDQ